MAGFYEFEVALADITPHIWRRFLLSKNSIFADLHHAIQASFGWENAHLWEFTKPGTEGEIIAGIPGEDRGGDITPDGWKVILSDFFDLGTGRDRCGYIYDFGDYWEHKVVLKKELAGAGDFFRHLVAGVMTESCVLA